MKPLSPKPGCKVKASGPMCDKCDLNHAEQLKAS